MDYQTMMLMFLLIVKRRMMYTILLISVLIADLWPQYCAPISDEAGYGIQYGMVRERRAGYYGMVRRRKAGWLLWKYDPTKSGLAIMPEPQAPRWPVIAIFFSKTGGILVKPTVKFVKRALGFVKLYFGKKKCGLMLRVVCRLYRD